KGNNLITGSDPLNGDDIYKFNSGKLMALGGMLGQKDLAEKKEGLAALQESMLQTAEEFSLDPISLSEGNIKKAKKGAKIKKAAPGDNIPSNPILGTIQTAVQKAASKHGLNIDILWKLINKESGGNINAVSNKDARGVMQLLPSTAKI